MTSPTAAAAPAPPGRPVKRQLRNYLLNPRFQLKYAGLLVTVAVVLMLALGALVWKIAETAARQAERAVRESQTTSHIMRMNDLMNAPDNPELVRTIERQLAEGDREAARNLEQVQQNRRRMLYTLVGSGLALVIALALAGIVITHKVVGPVFKLKRLLRQVGQGRLDIRERLRKGDELEDLFETFLQMVESLKDTQKQELARLESAIGELETSGASPTALEKLRELRSHMLVALAEPVQTRPPPAA